MVGNDRRGVWDWLCLGTYFVYFIALGTLRNVIPTILGRGIAEQFGWPFVFFTSDHFEHIGLDEPDWAHYLTVHLVKWTPHAVSLLAINMVICAALAAAFATALHHTVISLLVVDEEAVRKTARVFPERSRRVNDRGARGQKDGLTGEITQVVL